MLLENCTLAVLFGHLLYQCISERSIRMFQIAVTVLLEYIFGQHAFAKIGSKVLHLQNSIVHNAKYAEFHKNCTYYADIMLNALPTHLARNYASIIGAGLTRNHQIFKKQFASVKLFLY